MDADMILGTGRGDAAFHYLLDNPSTTKEELASIYELTLEESVSLFDAVECWHNCMED
jgi:hypothetical protein